MNLRMRSLIVLLGMWLTLSMSAQTIGDDVQPKVPQFPIEEMDSVVAHQADARYVVVYKGGKCGVYDLVKKENVTKLKYSNLVYGGREEEDGEYYTFFLMDEPERRGFVRITESTNERMGVWEPKDK